MAAHWCLESFGPAALLAGCVATVEERPPRVVYVGGPPPPPLVECSRLRQRRAWCGSKVIGTGTACNTFGSRATGRVRRRAMCGWAQLRVRRKTRLPRREMGSLHGGGGAEVTRAHAAVRGSRARSR